MLAYKNPMLWECAKEICKIKHEAKRFTGLKDLRKFVKDNRELLPEVVNGYEVKI
jgi:hypothetical protein